ncbi:hypothetical protein BDN72DRAFT_260056 [Pluteus cervinus]|uniref:Uncharacterized protein n=1 Tax=Pluteus cervinus TaxID=181527 RepID=A0ACD3AGD0_9AGAR|nr:hypothetical protein BDN72DRAFT_260056 [Pluteus cervinus]
MSTKISPSPFPIELVENVLEHAYAEYRPLEKPVTLYQCALVCQTWRIIAQSLIFSECVLSLGSPQIESLKRDDTIRHLVRRVWVNVVSGSSVNELSGLLPGLQEVYVLSQLDELFTFLSDPHTELPKPFMLANDTFVLGNLTSFGLSSISFPLKLFRHCTSLRELKINRCVFEHEDDADSLHAPQQLMLHSFHLRAHTHQEMDVISWMLSSNSPFNWTQLTTLRVCNQTHKFKTHKLVEALVERCASTLEDLMVEPPNGYPS